MPPPGVGGQIRGDAPKFSEDPERRRARLQRLAAEREGEVATPPHDDAQMPCLSFARDHCPPLNLSIQTKEQQRLTHRRCAPYVAIERRFSQLPPLGYASARFCGRRLPRTNPCWQQQGRTYCLPYLFILGEMK